MPAGTVGGVHVGELIRDHDIDYEVRRREALEDLVALGRLLAEVAEHAPGPWARQAACRGQTEVMFPGRGEPTGPANALCDACPVREPCAEWAATVPGDQHGIIAGTSMRTRRANRSAARIAAAA